jgi:hypothetical protein
MVLFFLINLVVPVAQMVEGIELVEECSFLIQRRGLHLGLVFPIIPSPEVLEMAKLVRGKH